MYEYHIIYVDTYNIMFCILRLSKINEAIGRRYQMFMFFRVDKFVQYNNSEWHKVLCYRIMLESVKRGIFIVSSSIYMYIMYMHIERFGGL